MRILGKGLLLLICGSVIMGCSTYWPDRVAKDRKGLTDQLIVLAEGFDQTNPEDSDCRVFLRVKGQAEIAEMIALRLLTSAEIMGQSDQTEDLRAFAALSVATAKLHERYWYDLLMKCDEREPEPDSVVYPR